MGSVLQMSRNCPVSAGMLAAALLPFLMTYLVRNGSSSVVYLDCAAVYQGPSSSLTNFPGHPQPPFYSSSAGCEQSTACDAKVGMVGHHMTLHAPQSA